MVAQIERELGAVNILVNNAGMARQIKLENIAEADWDEHINVNLKSAFLVTQAVLPQMRAQHWGRIINISSTAAQTGGLVGPHYAASKAGMLGLTHSYAALLAKEGITANTVCLALVETEMLRANPRATSSVIPIGRFGTVDEDSLRGANDRGKCLHDRTNRQSERWMVLELKRQCPIETVRRTLAIAEVVNRMPEKLRPDYDFVGTRGQNELKPALLIEFQRGGNVEIGDLYLPGPRSRGPIIRFRINRSIHDGVLAHFFLAAIVKYQHSGRKFARRLSCALLLRR